MATLLVADDEAKMRKILSLSLMEEGHEIIEAKDATEAISLLKSTTISLIISDLRMPGGGGMAVLDAAKQINAAIPIIILTAYGTIENAVEALKKGATDYLLKPCDLDEIKHAVNKALQYKHLELENAYLRQEVDHRFGDIQLVANSPVMQQVLENIRRAAQSESIVIIRGESGTGKELAARLIHRQSQRSKGPFIAASCTAIPPDLLEMDLFGRVRSQRGVSGGSSAGKFELADGGTLFLDEIGDLPHRMQGKILRAIEEQVIEPVGGTRSKKIDVRIIVASNMNLEEKVEEETMRSDLYYRLNVVPIVLPPLRERTEDIPALIKHFLNQKNRQRAALHFSEEDIGHMQRYHWPGNVRELENVVERAIVLGTTDLDVLLPNLRESAGLQQAQTAPLSELANLSYKEAKRHVLADFERNYFSHVLKQTGGNVSRAAQMTEVHRKNLHVKLSELGIDPHGFSPKSSESSSS